MESYELSDTQWDRIEGLLPGRQGWAGVTAKDNRSFVNGVLWVLRSGAQWKDLPARFGNWRSVHKRFTRRARSGIRQKIFRVLLDDPDNRCVMIDSTIVRAHLLSLPKGWIDHQDSHGVRRPGAANAPCSHWRTGIGRASGNSLADRH